MKLNVVKIAVLLLLAAFPARGEKKCKPTGGKSVTSGFVKITAGTFTMGGSPLNEKGPWPGETQHQVTLTVDFEMMKHEVTQKEFEDLTGYNPSMYSSCGSSCPVEEVSWHETLAYANALSAKNGYEQCFECAGTAPEVTCALKSKYSKPQDCPGYRLPTEAEWEYAARAGTKTAFYNGGISKIDCSPLDPNLGKIAWYCGNSKDKTHPVGKKRRNDWGLYDMPGSVLEWVWDWYEDYSSASVTDPFGPSTGTFRVNRGGSWDSFAQYCWAAYRSRYAPSVRDSDLGFRLVSTL